MAEYIEREALLREIERRDRLMVGDKTISVGALKRFILNRLSADVAPVRHGRWEMNSDRPDNIICTNCDVGFDVWKHEAKDFNYCPNCGAKMDLEG